MGLEAYNHVRTALFVRIHVEEYLQSGGNLAPTTLLFSDHYKDYDLDGETYTALGNLMSVTSTLSELQSTSANLTIQLSGIPNRSLEEIVKSKIKASPVQIKRVFFAQNGEIIDDSTVTNPVGRFVGYVNNYALEEEWDTQTKTSTNTITLECSSTVDVLSRKQAGRKTNPNSMKKYYASDVSFDRVPAILNENLNFGRSQ